MGEGAALARQQDRRKLAAVALLAAVGCTTEAEELVLPPIGAGRNGFDPSDARNRKPADDVASKVEAVMAGLITGHEPSGIVFALCQEAGQELGSNFVIGLIDTGSYGGHDFRSLGPESFHCPDRGFQDPRQCALPSRMSRADHLRFCIRQ